MVLKMLIFSMISFSLSAMNDNNNRKEESFLEEKASLKREYEEKVAFLEKMIKDLSSESASLGCTLQEYQLRQHENFKKLQPCFFEFVKKRDGNKALDLLTMFSHEYIPSFHSGLSRDDRYWLLLYAAEHDRLKIFANNTCKSSLGWFFIGHAFPGIQHENASEHFLVWCAQFPDLLEDVISVCLKYNFEKNIQTLIDKGFIGTNESFYSFIAAMFGLSKSVSHH